VIRTVTAVKCIDAISDVISLLMLLAVVPKHQQRT